MKRSFVFFLLLLNLFWPRAFSQFSNADIDSLIKNKQWEQALQLLPAAMSRDSAMGNWDAYEALALDRVKALYALKTLKNYQQAIEVIEQTTRVLHSAGQKGKLSEAKLAVWKAFMFRLLEQYLNAFDAYCEAINIFESNQFNGPDLAFCYKNAAQIAMRWSNYNLAEPYLQAALRGDTTMKYGLSIYSQLANNAYWQDSLEKSERLFEIGRKLLATDKDLHAAASLRQVGSLIFFQKKQYSESHSLAQQAFAYYRTQPAEEIDNRIRTLTILAHIAARQNNIREAEQYFQKAEAEGKTFYKGKSREMAKLYTETGFFYEKTGRPENALAFYQTALVQSFPNFNSLNISENPPLGDAWLESQAMRAAAAKALMLAKNSDLDSRLNAAHCFDLSFAVAAQLRRTYGDDADKFALAANNRENYNAAALNLWQLWREKNDPTILARLFAFLEQTKAQALGDALQQQRALALAGIPDSLLVREENLRLEVAGFVGDLKKKEEKGDSAEIVAVKDRIFKHEKTYHDFLETLKNQFPQFRQFTEASLTANLSDIQASLPDTAALLSWFDAGDRYLCLTVRRESLAAFELPRDSILDGKLSHFLGILADRNSQQTNPDAYFSEAHFLFQKLLPDPTLSSVRSLIIIPDGQLCYLPFEALLTAKHEGSFASAPYLLRSKIVHYAWTATLLTLPPVGKSGEKGLLQIAPFTQSARDGLAVLTNSTHDTPETISVSVLDGAQATTDEFLKKAPRHSVIHLSTHADAGGSGTPGIELYDRRLTLPEIYAQRFHASLVSLSACETGKGQFAKGEGVLSLARAFAYAGAQSLVASHWSVNERSTAELFSSFYKNLQNGLSKAEALRQAKLDYLASSELDARKVPFHWAAFTLTGADGPVDFGANNLKKWLWGIIGLFALLALFIWFYFFKTGKITPEL